MRRRSSCRRAPPRQAVAQQPPGSLESSLATFLPAAASASSVAATNRRAGVGRLRARVRCLGGGGPVCGEIEGALTGGPGLKPQRRRRRTAGGRSCAGTRPSYLLGGLRQVVDESRRPACALPLALSVAPSKRSAKRRSSRYAPRPPLPRRSVRGLRRAWVLHQREGHAIEVRVRIWEPATLHAANRDTSSFLHCAPPCAGTRPAGYTQVARSSARRLLPRVSKRRCACSLRRGLQHPAARCGSWLEVRPRCARTRRACIRQPHQSPRTAAASRV